ncbi:uncharacterized protein V6R79_000054 [Siganus canaliculatus]
MPVDTSPDILGRWYIIAMSSGNCWFTSSVNAFFSISAAVNINATNTPTTYEGTFSVKIYGHCSTEKESFVYGNSTDPSDETDVLLQTGCPDCLVIKTTDTINALLLLSRRQTVTEAELKEFGRQTRCLRWSKTYVLNSDHDYENCSSIDDGDIDVDVSQLSTLMLQRLGDTYVGLQKCLEDTVLYYPRAVIQWFRRFMLHVPG